MTSKRLAYINRRTRILRAIAAGMKAVDIARLEGMKQGTVVAAIRRYLRQEKREVAA